MPSYPKLDGLSFLSNVSNQVKSLIFISVFPSLLFLFVFLLFVFTANIAFIFFISQSSSLSIVLNFIIFGVSRILLLVALQKVKSNDAIAIRYLASIELLFCYGLDKDRFVGTIRF